MHCIILAGGKGTRLQSVVSDQPKCLADVNGVPFLEYLLEYLEDEGVQEVTLSLGYKYEQVFNKDRFRIFQIAKINIVILDFFSKNL